MTEPLHRDAHLDHVALASPEQVRAGQQQARALWRRERDALPVEAPSREDELVLERRRNAFEREEEAIGRWSQRERGDRPTALVVHRHEWLRTRVDEALAGRGWEVLDGQDQAAEAVGALVATQPEVLLISDRVAGAPGVELVSRVRALSPGTRVLVQVDQDSRAAALVAAGAHLVLSHRSTWQELVEAVHDLSPVGV